MKKEIKKININKSQEPIAKKVRETIQKSVLNSPRDSRTKKFPENLPVSNYVAITPIKFKKMQHKDVK